MHSNVNYAILALSNKGCDVGKLTNNGFGVIVVLFISVVVTALGFGGWYVFNKRADSNDANNALQNTDATNTQTSITPNAVGSTDEVGAKPTRHVESKPLRDVTVEGYGTTFKLPSDWIENGGSIGRSIGYQGFDAENKIYITLSISRDFPEVTLGCYLIAKDSEDLKYDNPLPGQRTTTKLSFSTASNETKTLCGVMITGAYSAKTGDVFSPIDKTLQDSLPNNRIVAYISTDPYVDPITKETISWPKIDTVLNSPKYAELIAALKSIQVK